MTDERNRLAHGLAQDREALMRDQEEIRDDYRVALIVLLANERPDLLLRAAEELIRSETDADRKSRARMILIAALKDAIANPNIGLEESLKAEDVLNFPPAAKD